MTSVGTRVCIRGVQSRRELNGRAGRVASVDQSRGRCGVCVEGLDEMVSLKQSCLSCEDRPPWEHCRHGGPKPDDAMGDMMATFQLQNAVLHLTAPCLEHVRLLEPHVRRAAPQPIIMASMAIDAYIENDFAHCRSFTVCAVVLDAVRAAGADALFSSLKAADSGQSPVVRRLAASLAKCTAASGLLDILSSYAQCDCLHLATARGIGISQASLTPQASPVDDLWEGRGQPPMPQAPHAVTLGEGLARRAVELLDEPRHCSNPAAELRAEADGLLAGARSADRGETRELTLSAMQAGAVAGKAFVDSGGMSQLERTLERGLEAQSQLSARDAEAWSRGVAGAELLLAFEVLHALHSVPVALAALQGRACSLVCRLIDAAKTFAVAHNAVRALWGILSAAHPTEYAPVLDAPSDGLVGPVVEVLGCMLFDQLQDDMLQTACLDIIVGVATHIAAGSADLARRIATTRARGVPHCIPISLYLMLAHHAHEQRAGRFDRKSPLGQEQHVHPISWALEGLYTLSLQFDLRAVRIGSGDGDETNGFADALSEYADFLYGFVHHQVCSPHMQEYLKRLTAFTPQHAPPLDPPPPLFETAREQQLRLRQCAHALQLTRAQVREQRRRGPAPSVEQANALRERGNDAFRANELQAAATAYAEAVAALTGFEHDASAAWPLVLALSNRSQALLQLGRHEEVLEDCTNAAVLLERFDATLDPADAARVREKLARREAASSAALEAQQRGAARAEAAQQAAAQRRQARTDRRRRSREAAAARRAREQAESEAELRALEEAVAAARLEQAQAEPEVECTICQEGTEEGPLEDACGHSHLLHPGCAAMWRARCVEQHRQDPLKFAAPHCPTCRRPI